MKTLLAYEGGGMKGMVACAVLEELERRSGKTVPELFDLGGGASVGGIALLSIGAGNTAADTLNFFKADGPNIFHQGFLNNAVAHEAEGKGYYKYDPAPLEEALRSRMRGMKVSDSKMPLIVPAADRVSRQLVFFKTDDFETKDYPMWQVGRATSAAQTYFPPYKLDKWSFFDGGTGANNPAVCVHALAVKTWPGEAFRMLFLGCGDVAPNPDVPDNPGPFDLLHESVEMMLACTDGVPDYQMRQYLGADYHALQPKGQMPALDDASPAALAAMAKAAAETIEQYTDEIDLFCRKPA